jgi:hypothetical protein
VALYTNAVSLRSPWLSTRKPACPRGEAFRADLWQDAGVRPLEEPLALSIGVEIRGGGKPAKFSDFCRRINWLAGINCLRGLTTFRHKGSFTCFCERFLTFN